MHMVSTLWIVAHTDEFTTALSALNHSPLGATLAGLAGGTPQSKGAISELRQV